MSENPPAVVDADAFTVRRTIRIDATPDAVWRAITEPALISQWFGDAAFDGFAVGALGTLSWPDYGAAPVRIEAIDEPHSVSYRWADAAEYPGVSDVDAVPSTVFTFTLEAVDGGTQLTVVETGFETTRAPEENLESHRDGWNSELDELVALLEAAA